MGANSAGLVAHLHGRGFVALVDAVQPRQQGHHRDGAGSDTQGPHREANELEGALPAWGAGLRAFGLIRTKREAVELSLRILVKLNQQEGLRAFRGKLRWDGDLEALRLDAAAPLPGVDPEEGIEP